MDDEDDEDDEADADFVAAESDGSLNEDDSDGEDDETRTPMARSRTPGIKRAHLPSAKTRGPDQKCMHLVTTSTRRVAFQYDEHGEVDAPAVTHMVVTHSQGGEVVVPFLAVDLCTPGDAVLSEEDELLLDLKAAIGFDGDDDLLASVQGLTASEPTFDPQAPEADEGDVVLQGEFEVRSRRARTSRTSNRSW